MIEKRILKYFTISSFLAWETKEENSSGSFHYGDNDYFSTAFVIFFFKTDSHICDPANSDIVVRGGEGGEIRGLRKENKALGRV